MPKRLVQKRRRNVISKHRGNSERNDLLSIIWIFVLFNMIYADIIGMLVPGYLELLDGYSKLFTWRTLLLFSLLLEIPIAMTLLSQVLNDRANRWAHTVAVPVTILFVIWGGNAHPHYLFFATIESVAMLFTLWLAWRKWPTPEFSPTQNHGSREETPSPL